MSDHDALEHRLGQVERSIRAQRAICAGLAVFLLVGVLAASRSPEPEVVRASLFEVVDEQGRAVGGFGIGAAAGESTHERGTDLGWVLESPDSGARASLRVGQDEKLSELRLKSGGKDSASLAAMETGASLELDWNGERSATLTTQESQWFLAFHRSDGGRAEDTALVLSHSGLRPALKGWDDHGNLVIDLE